jgi:hypothetical protein
VDGSKVWACLAPIRISGVGLWDPRLIPCSAVQYTYTLQWQDALGSQQARIKNVDTGEVVFQLSERFTKPTDVKFDGPYLVTGYQSGEILIVELKHILV